MLMFDYLFFEQFSIIYVLQWCMPTSCHEYSDCMHVLHCPRLVILNMMDVPVYIWHDSVSMLLVLVNVQCNPLSYWSCLSIVVF